MDRLWFTLRLRYNPNGTGIIKANVPVNFIIPPLMQTSTFNKVVIMYVTFDDYMLSVLKSFSHHMWVERIVSLLLKARSAWIKTSGSMYAWTVSTVA